MSAHVETLEVDRVRCLAAFALGLARDRTPHEMVERTADALRQCFDVERVFLLGDPLRKPAGRMPMRVPPAGVPTSPWVGPCPPTYSDGPASPEETLAVVLPIRHWPGATHLVAVGRSGDDVPLDRHRLFVTLVHEHLDRATQAVALVDALDTRTRELTQRNAELAAALERAETARARLADAGKLEAMGRLAGGIAHDFNNLLTVITANASVLELEFEDGDERGELVHPIVDAAAYASRLTKQLLTFARRRPTKVEPVDLNHVLDNFARMIVRLIGEQIEVRLQLDPRVDEVRADRTGMEQILMNLALNARDAMPEGGLLTIETRLSTLEDVQKADAPRPPSAYFSLVVSDSGVGMSAETRARMFEPLFSTHSPDAQGKGSGLGMAIVSEIVAETGGHIRVESELGRGTRFTVLLPNGEQRSEAHSGTFPRRRVLVVDDQAPVRSAVRAILEAEGYVVVEARDATEAVGLFGPDIDVVITDIAMPGLDGARLATMLRRTRPELAVVLMSGRLWAPGSGQTEETFLAKPFGATELLESLGEAVRRRETRVGGRRVS